MLTFFHIKISVPAFLMNTNHFVWSILSRLEDLAINTIANLFLHERLWIPEAYSDIRMEIFANSVSSYKSWTNICKLLHLTCSTRFWLHLCILLPRIFFNTFREITFTKKKKKMERIKEWNFAHFDETLPNKLFLPKNPHYIISLNKKIKWLKSLFTCLLKAKK